ncbi:hypothetical protein Sm713_39050 [Streptomyces sp. TS71-3]|nr:hypothetical protein Sm713_39050 [Streptomyces sp. TS71-3]
MKAVRGAPQRVGRASSPPSQEAVSAVFRFAGRRVVARAVPRAPLGPPAPAVPEREEPAKAPRVRR